MTCGHSNKKVIVRVEGVEDNKELALYGLMRDTEYTVLKRVMNDLPIAKVIRIAQIVHGIMYREIQGY